MNAATRATVTATPIPVENGVPVEACVMNDADGEWRTAWMFDGGRRKEIFGPVYSLADALLAALTINDRGASA